MLKYRRSFLMLFLACSMFPLHAQSQGYDLKINLSGLKDTTVFLAKYFWDQVPIVDSSKNIRNGRIRFAGTQSLDPGLYIVANQARNSFYFQFIVDKNQKFTLSANADDVNSTMKTEEKLNAQFFSYVTFMTNTNKRLAEFREKMRGKKDSAKQSLDFHVKLNEETVKFDQDFMNRNKGTFVWDLLNLKNEKYPTDVPKASNGRPDSIYQYQYYKNHYFDGINFRDDRLVYTPFFADKIKTYFDRVVPHHPDSVIRDLDKILSQCVPGSTMFNTLLGHFTYKYETNKEMSFDQHGKSNTFEKVFVHLSEKYIITGMTKGYYSDETVKTIAERVKILKNLLPGSKVAELYVIDTIHGRTVLKMGFDTASTSQSCTDLYNKNLPRLTPMFKRLSDVKAKYTILLFWAADCGHCLTEVPKLSEDLRALRETIDFRVFAVQTKEDLFDKWTKLIVEKKLDYFINVFDPIHLNNLKENFDIQGTPVIYLLDRDKRILGKKLATENVVDILKKLEEIEKASGKQ